MIPEYAGLRVWEVSRLVADARQARELLGWEPRIAFDTGLEDLVEWYRTIGNKRWNEDTVVF